MLAAIAYVENGASSKTVLSGFNGNCFDGEDLQTFVKENFKIELTLSQAEELIDDEILILRPMAIKDYIFTSQISLQIIQIE